MPGLQLSILFARFDRKKHPHALDSLLRTLDRLTSVDPYIAVVDNAHPGDWTHRGAEGLVRLGGDGWAREFSAFDRGIATLATMGRQTDIFAVVTDSLLAYGEDYLDLIDDHAIATCHRLQACVGLVDTWGRGCRIGDLPFDAWLRTCFVLVPAKVLAALGPLAADLEPLRLFGSSATQPFSSQARLNPKVQQCLVEWLTMAEVPSPRLQWHWHSRFELTAESLPLFQAKASAILREQLLSARLRHAQVPCYDYRCIRRLAERGDLEAFLDAGGQEDLQWLGWMTGEEPAGTVRLSAAPEPAGSDDSASPPEAPVLLLLAGPDEHQSRRAAADFERAVLPLIRQRHSGARLLLADPDSPGGPAAFGERPGIIMRLASRPGQGPAKRSRPLASLALTAASADPASEIFAHDGSAPAIARVCCRLLESRGA